MFVNFMYKNVLAENSTRKTFINLPVNNCGAKVSQIVNKLNQENITVSRSAVNHSL